MTQLMADKVVLKISQSIREYNPESENLGKLRFFTIPGLSIFFFQNCPPTTPPFFTLDDRADFSPEADLLPPSLVSPIGARSWGQKGLISPFPSYSSSSRFLPTRAAEANGSGPSNRRGKSPEGSSWVISPAENGGEQDPDCGLPVDGVVESGVLIVLPPPPSTDLPRPELQGPVVLNGGLEADTILPWLCIRNTCPLCRFELQPMILNMRSGKLGEKMMSPPLMNHSSGMILK
ncbi:nuclear pore complex protein NUP35-like [Zingiber officinale]|uniref:nuclear pore complex protein NUP35-like n=1 Tax=Zingiber officinale TaxID=94328 RepID=UPI001C4B7B49|nr:nuclear pore complex protein NUP35-like [Zingiber officinale]